MTDRKGNRKFAEPTLNAWGTAVWHRAGERPIGELRDVTEAEA